MESGYVKEFDAETFVVSAQAVALAALANEARVTIYASLAETDVIEKNIVRGQE